MIMDASSKIAVKCSECGKYNLVDLNLFKLNSFNMKQPTSIHCECGHRMLKAHVARKQLILDIDCIACEKQHTYRFKLSDIMEKETNIIGCPVTGIEIAFLGKDDHINEIVERYLDEMQEIFESFGVIGNVSQKVVR